MEDRKTLLKWDLDKNLRDFYVLETQLRKEGQQSRADVVLYLIERCLLAESKLEQLKPEEQTGGKEIKNGFVPISTHQYYWLVDEPVQIIPFYILEGEAFLEGQEIDLFSDPKTFKNKYELGYILGEEFKQKEVDPDFTIYVSDKDFEIHFKGVI